MKCRFEIVGLSGIDGVPNSLKVNGKQKYRRLLIKKVKEEDIKEPKDVALLMEYNKKFLIIGNGNAVTYKDIFPYIKNNELWLGVSITSGDRRFDVPSDYPLEAATCGIDEDGVRFIRVKGVRWFTNIDNQKRNTPLDLYKHYNAEEYPKYDNYDAIEVSKTCEIPMDYDGVMGVPITFLDKYCPTQFEIKGFWNTGKAGEEIGATYCDAISAGKLISWNGPTVNKQTKYFRILIKRVSKNNF